MQSSTIAILMATYNGEKYLAEQIDSLLAQTYHSWHLYVHDDGSTDDTLAIVRRYTEKYPEKITLFDYPAQGSACRNFMSLLEKVEARYYMFCDQDDVWINTKIEQESSAMKNLEIQMYNQPIIVNSDLVVVDVNLQTIHPSYWQYQNIYPDFVKRFEDFSATNVVTGCTMLFNQQAKEVIQKPTVYTIMHDAWITLCVVSNNGILYNMKTQTVLYRQHEKNSIGAKDAKRLTLKYRIRHFVELTLLLYHQFKQLNVISHVSLYTFMMSKIHYKMYIRQQNNK